MEPLEEDSGLPDVILPPLEVVDSIDLLFVVDNSGSMEQEQASIARAIPQLLESLTTGDLNADGIPDGPGIPDIHVGVVSSDMGVGGVGTPTCLGSAFGDDGMMISNPLCTEEASTGFLQFSGVDEVRDAFIAGASCGVRLGTNGCGFEQQLEATLKALTPSRSPLEFYLGTRGHADGSNAGFLRDNSILAIVMLTDEDDCSTTTPDLFDASSDRFSGNLNLRCFQYSDALHSLSRYVEGLSQLRARAPHRLVFLPIVGVPVDLVGDGLDIDISRVLADPRMVGAVNPANPTQLNPSCDSPTGRAFPPRRIMRAAQLLQEEGALVLAGSICQEDFSVVFDSLSREIHRVARFDREER